MSQETENTEKVTLGNCSGLDVKTEHNSSLKTDMEGLSQNVKSRTLRSIDEISVDGNSVPLPVVSVACIAECSLGNSQLHGAIAEGFAVEAGAQGEPVNVQDVATILNSKEARVMYINADGTLIFDHPVLPVDSSENMPIILDTNTNSIASISTADTTVNSNYLVVVENIDGSQMLSTTMNGSVVLSTGSNVPVAGVAPETQVSFSPGNDKGGSKLRNVAGNTQQTITMVLNDSSPSLKSKGILVGPNTFITYNDQAAVSANQITFHAVHSVSDKTESSPVAAHMYEPVRGSFFDISALGVLASEIPSSSTIHHKPNSQTAPFSTQATQTIIVKEQAPVKRSAQKSLLKSCQEPSVSIYDNATAANNPESAREKSSKKNEVEQAKKERLKQELRFLEQSHLEHHLKQAQKKQGEIDELESFQLETENGHNEKCETSNENTAQYEKVAFDDETPIFTIVTATLNSTILADIPGCQQFLLDKAQENCHLDFHIDFSSDTGCTFSGTLKSLVILHNILKNSIKLKSRTLLEFRDDKTTHSGVDKSVMCDLLKPYISLRGRQPRCSLKAAEMGFVNEIDLYLQADTAQDSGDTEYGRNVAVDRFRYKRKRKRGSPAKESKDRVNKFKFECTPDTCDVMQINNAAGEDKHLNSQKELQDFESGRVNDDDDGVAERLQECKNEPSVVTVGENDFTDPLQQRLLEEQVRYQKLLNQKRRQQSFIFNIDSNVSMACNTDMGEDLQNKNDVCTAEIEASQENALAPETLTVERRRRGRPRKTHNYHPLREKVQARNPLTESATTKQQRSYEEQVSFKFFCTQCSFKTKRHSHFVSHQRCHRDGTEKKYTCKQCDFVTISIPMLKRHELKHSKSLFRCAICTAYTTDRQELLRRHVRMKHSIEAREVPKGKLNCDRCRFTCLTSEELEKHKNVHDRLNQVPDGDILNCPECKKPFRSRMHLQRHMRDVHGPEVRPHLCDKCGKAFKRTDALQQHKLVHLSRTARSFPFKCSSCDKGFRSPAHLKEHMSMHSSERPFLCQYCGASFKTQPVQKKHILTLHIRPRAHVCNVCHRQFNTKHALQRHENTHTKPDSVTEAAILVMERENAVAEKEAAVMEKDSAPASADSKPAGLSINESAQVPVEGQLPNCLVQDIIGTASEGIDEPLEQSGQTLQQAYIQGTQDGTLYYFTGELPTL